MIQADFRVLSDPITELLKEGQLYFILDEQESSFLSQISNKTMILSKYQPIVKSVTLQESHDIKNIREHLMKHLVIESVCCKQFVQSSGQNSVRTRSTRIYNVEFVGVNSHYKTKMKVHGLRSNDRILPETFECFNTLIIAAIFLFIPSSIQTRVSSDMEFQRNIRFIQCQIC